MEKQQIARLWEINPEKYYSRGEVSPTGRCIDGQSLAVFWHEEDTILVQEENVKGWGGCSVVISVSSPYVGDCYFLAQEAK